MAHAIDGARFKVLRARTHLETLSAELTAYLARQPGEHVVTRPGHSATGGLPITQPPNAEWSAIIGDFLGNCRAALDYVAWELASKHAGRSLIPGEDRTYFPLVPTAPDFWKAIRSLRDRYHVPQTVLDAIEAVQPYHPAFGPLGWLQALVNQDKHRTLVLMLAHVEVDELTLTVNGQLAITGTGASVLTVGLHGYPAGGGGPHVHVGGDAVVTVVFENAGVPGPVDSVLGQIHVSVEDTLSRLERFLS